MTDFAKESNDKTVRNILIGFAVLIIICGCLLLCCSSSFSMLTHNTTTTEEEKADDILDVDEYDYAEDDNNYDSNDNDNVEDLISPDINKPLDESTPPEKPKKTEEETNDKPRSIKASDAKLINENGKYYLILGGKSKLEIRKNSIKKKNNNIYLILTSGKKIVIVGNNK